MNDTARIRQLAHERAGTARVIEMYVRQENPIDIGRSDSLLGERFEQARHGMRSANVDKRRTSGIDEQMARREPRPYILNVDRVQSWHAIDGQRDSIY
jgi:hypothetical protein